MSRNKWFDHRITVTMTDDMLQAIDRHRSPKEIRLDFIRMAIENEVRKRKAAEAAGPGRFSLPRPAGAARPI